MESSTGSLGTMPGTAIRPPHRGLRSKMGQKMVLVTLSPKKIDGLLFIVV